MTIWKIRGELCLLLAGIYWRWVEGKSPVQMVAWRVDP